MYIAERQTAEVNEAVRERTNANHLVSVSFCLYVQYFFFLKRKKNANSVTKVKAKLNEISVSGCRCRHLSLEP